MYGRGGTQIRFGPPQTPDVIKYLVIANVGVYLLQHLLFSEQWWLVNFAVIPKLVWQAGYIWQPFTYMWLHAPHQVTHLLFNMFALWMFGSPVASYWGDRKFLRFYLLCGTGAGILIAAWPGVIVLFGGSPGQYVMPTLGASGAIMGALLAYSLLWPDRTIMLLFPPIPLKAIYFIPFLLVMELLAGPANVSHLGHLGGLLVGWLLLRQMGVVHGLGLDRLKWRWRRYKMRRNLRSVQDDRWRRHDDDRTFH